ncbi:Multidrug resistance regulator 1 [Cyberlindnera fabianii]|uniref:Multidrug resistance regulator 1 n=1 Tax=Cyberlindnera fabianii TaxID=36022 RepID=A0A1V2LDA2_CYBFA|nr:Multidrug resistance regulator 1 [Cyberlindnera fabianii]
MSNEESVRRARIPNSCILCRKRRIRCDKARPSCEQCGRRGVAHLCSYKDPAWMKEALEQAGAAATVEGSSTKDEHNGGAPLHQLLARIKKLESDLAQSQSSSELPSIHFKKHQYDPDELVSLQSTVPFVMALATRKMRLEYHGATSPLVSIQSSEDLRAVWIHMWRFMEKTMISREAALKHGLPTVLNDGHLNIMLMRFLELKREKTALKGRIKELDNYNGDLESMILDHLPPRRVILRLCMMFFKYIYPLMPLLEEGVFFTDTLSRLIGGWSNVNEPIPRLYITEKYDYATLGLLFIIMAITVLSLEQADFDINKDLTYLKGVCTAIFPGIANHCLSHYNFLAKSYGAKVVLLMLYIHFYRQFCPEDDTSSEFASSRIFLDAIISNSMAAGLHCDPSEMAAYLGKPENRARICRKMWHKIVEMDASVSANNGFVPRFLDDESYDCELPANAAGTDDPETFVLNDYIFMDKKTALFRKVCQVVFLRGKKPTVAQMFSVIEDVASFVAMEVGTLSFILSSNPVPYVKVKKIAYLFELHALELILRYRLLLHFHHNDNPKMHAEMYQNTLRLAVQVFNSALNIHYNGSEYFGTKYLFYIRPALFSAVSRSMVVIADLYCTCLHQFLVPNTPEAQYKSLKELQTNLLCSMDSIVQFFQSINTGYYNAQRMTLGTTLFLHVVKDPHFSYSQAVEEVQSSLPDHALPLSLKAGTFLGTLTSSEIDTLKNFMSTTPLTTLLQPVGGPSRPLHEGAMLFPPATPRNVYHFGSPVPTPSRKDYETAQMKVKESLAFRMNHQMATRRQITGIFGESITTQLGEINGAYGEKLDGLNPSENEHVGSAGPVSYSEAIPTTNTTPQFLQQFRGGNDPTNGGLFEQVGSSGLEQLLNQGAVSVDTKTWFSSEDLTELFGIFDDAIGAEANSANRRPDLESG